MYHFAEVIDLIILQKILPGKTNFFCIDVILQEAFNVVQIKVAKQKLKEAISVKQNIGPIFSNVFFKTKLLALSIKTLHIYYHFNYKHSP